MQTEVRTRTMATHDRETRPSAQVLLLAILTALAAGYGMADFVRQAAVLGPRVGDIIAFDPANPAQIESDARLNASRPGGADCALDAGLLRHSGGSLVLEQRNAGPDRLFRAHWT